MQPNGVPGVAESSSCWAVDKLTSGPGLAVVVVAYESASWLSLTLQSVRKAAENSAVEVCVVDNSTSHAVAQLMAMHFAEYRYLRLTCNHGFGTACNRGVAATSAPYVLLLNPDTVVPSNCFLEWMAHFQRHPELHAAGNYLFNGRGHYLRESKRGFPGFLASCMKLSGLWRLGPNSSFWSGYYLGHLPAGEEHQVPVLSGACMAFPRELFERTGGFDPSFFMYGEDVDLSWRMHLAGSGNRYLGHVKVLHFKGRSTPVAWRYVWHFYASMWHFAQKHLWSPRLGFMHVVGYVPLVFLVGTGYVGRLLRRKRKPPASTTVTVFNQAIAAKVSAQTRCRVVCNPKALAGHQSKAMVLDTATFTFDEIMSLIFTLGPFATIGIYEEFTGRVLNWCEFIGTQK